MMAAYGLLKIWLIPGPMVPTLHKNSLSAGSCTMPAEVCQSCTLACACCKGLWHKKILRGGTLHGHVQNPGSLFRTPQNDHNPHHNDVLRAAPDLLHMRFVGRILGVVGFQTSSTWARQVGWVDGSGSSRK